MIDTLVGGQTVDHCIIAESCGDDHDIISLQGSLGSTVISPLSVPFDTCFSYTAPSGFSGIDTVTIEVINEFGVSSKADVYFFVEFNAPVAENDSIVIVTNGIDTLNILANDTDVDENIVVSSVTVISGPSATGASVSVLPNGEVVIDYSGSNGFFGNDTIYYSVCDNTVPTPLCDTAL